MVLRSPFTLSVGTLVGKGSSIYFANLLPFTVLSALVLSPWIAFRLLVEHPDPADDAPSVVPLLGMLLESFLAFVLTGAVTYGVVMQLREQHASLGDALGRGLKSLFAVIGTGALCVLRIFLFTLLLIIPGIIQAVKLYVALPVAVMEGKGGGEAIRRSQQLTEGSRWPIFGSWLLIMVVTMGLGFVAGFLTVGSKTFGPSVIACYEIGIALIMNAFSATLMAVCYFQLRQGKENVDAKQIAAVFD